MSQNDADQTQSKDNLWFLIWDTLTGRERFVLTFGSVICIALTLWIGRLLHLPAIVGRAGTILQQPGWPVQIGTIWLLIVACSVLAAVVTIRLHYDAGLFCAGIAVVAISVQSGPSRFALLTSNGPATYLAMAVELLLIYVGMAIAWFLLYSARGSLLASEPPLDPTEPEITLDQKLIAMAAQTVLVMIGMLILCQSDAKPQVLASLGIACFFGTIGAHHFIPTRPSIWYWVGPLFVGLIGYSMQYFNPYEWMIGDSRGFFAPLARPLPLDYAGMGVAASLLGYWTSQRWRRGAIDEAEENL